MEIRQPVHSEHAHPGVGTRAYTFIWGMTGENQVFPDMDGVVASGLR